MIISRDIFIVNKTRFYIIVATFALSVAISLRIFGKDRDYYSYLSFFEKTVSNWAYNSRFEPGFEFFTRAFGLVFGPESFILFLFAIAFISIYLKLSILSHVRNYKFMVLIYIMLILPLHEMTQVRVGLASGVVYLALYLATFVNSHLIKKTLVTATGVLFHYSVMIVAPFVLLRIFRKKSITLVFIVAVLPAVFINNTLGIVQNFIPFIEYYLYEVTLKDEANINLFSSRNIILSALLLLGLFNMKYMSETVLPWFYDSICGIGLWYGFLWLPIFAHRFLEITVFSYLIWVPSLPNKSRIIALSLLLVLAAYMIIRMLFISPYFV